MAQHRGEKVEKGRIVTIAYRVTADGEVVEESTDGVAYMHGVGMLLPALEEQLGKLRAGDSFDFVTPPKDAYGERDESNIVTLPRAIFPSHLDVSVGARLAAKTHGGDTYPLTVREVYADRVLVDLNHPLAGKSLRFMGRVVTVRIAASQEVFSGKPRPVEVV